MFDINQVITDHINSIEEPGVRDWLTKLHEAKAFTLGMGAEPIYHYQDEDYGCLTQGEMRRIFGVLEAIEKGLAVDAGLYRSNGGVLCDNLNGPCSCGAWHNGDDNVQI